MDPNEYTTRNYNPINRAITNEVEKQAALNALAASKARLRLVLAATILCIGLAIVVLISVIIYKFWQYQFGSEPTTNNPVEQPQKVVDMETDAQKEHQEGLEQLSQDSISEPLITTRFTVFKDTIIDTGETVVTGLEYDPANLQVPFSQYCYLEQGDLGGVPLAAVDSYFKIEHLDTDPYHNGLAQKYCLFVLPNSK